MPGYDQKRFVDLSEREAKHLECSICLNIFNNAVITDCGHSFCTNCLKDGINNGLNTCPQCKAPFTRKRCVGNSVIIGGYVFRPNFIVNSMVSQLTAKCDFESNGCQEKIEIGLLSAHIKVCEHRLCSICGLIAGKSGDHNCVELLKKDRNHFKNKFENSDKSIKEQNKQIFKLQVLLGKVTSDKQQKCNELEERISKLSGEIEKLKLKHPEDNGQDWRIASSTFKEDTYQGLKVWEKVYENKSQNDHELTRIIRRVENKTQPIEMINQMLYKYHAIRIGTYMYDEGQFETSSRGINLLSLHIRDSKTMLFIPFTQMEEILYSTDQKNSVILIKPSEKLCTTINSILHLCIFTVNSTGQYYGYIQLTLNNDMSESQWRSLLHFLEQKSQEIEPAIKFEAIAFNHNNELDILFPHSNPQTPGAGMEHAFSVEWPTTDIEVRIKDVHNNRRRHLIGETGIIRGIFSGMCRVFLLREDREVAVLSEHLEPVMPSEDDKIKVIFGEGREKTGTLLTIGGNKGLVGFNSGDTEIILLRYLCKFRSDW